MSETQPRTIGRVKTNDSAITRDETLEQCYLIAFKVAYRLLGNEDAAKDVGIEAVSRVLEKGLSDKEYVIGYAAKIASSIVISNWRKDATAKKYSVKLSHSESDNSIEISELRLDLRRAIAKLPKRQKEIVVLRYLADLTEAQVASFLHISLGTVKSTTHEALSRLKTMVEVTP